jgi:hypothetical protein
MTLEDRLPPGDAAISMLLGWSLAGPLADAALAAPANDLSDGPSALPAPAQYSGLSDSGLGDGLSLLGPSIVSGGTGGSLGGAPDGGTAQAPGGTGADTAGGLLAGGASTGLGGIPATNLGQLLNGQAAKTSSAPAPAGTALSVSGAPGGGTSPVLGGGSSAALALGGLQSAQGSAKTAGQPEQPGLGATAPPARRASTVDWASVSKAHNVQLQQSYGQLPLSFEANQGQADSQVQFLSRGAGYTLFLTPSAAVLNLQQAAAPRTPGAPADAGAAGTVLTMQVVGGNPAATAVAQDELPGKVNYLTGSDPSQWHTNIATYGQVAYQGVYPGINLVYYGNQGQLEYDFDVAPGADPSAIALSFAGADQVTVNPQGELVLHSAGGDVVQHAPFLYQDVGGVRQEVAGGYVLTGPGQVHFQVGAYDTSRALVIDPVLSYGTYLGGARGDLATAVAADGSGSAYVTGTTNSTDFPTTAGAFKTTRQGAQDAFVTKLTPDGTALVYSTYLGGTAPLGNISVGLGIAVDGSGNAYVTGFTNSDNFPTTVTGTRGAGFDAFVTKLNAGGTGVLFSRYLGGSVPANVMNGPGDFGNAIAVDASGNIYVAGESDTTDFPTTAGAFKTTFGGGNADGFVTEISAAGTLAYSTYLGGTGDEAVFGIAVDGSGNAYVGGLTTSLDFPTTPGAFKTMGDPDVAIDGFVTKLNATGSAQVYSTYLGGDMGAQGLGSAVTSIAVDANGDAYVTGLTDTKDFPLLNALSPGMLDQGNPLYTDAIVTQLKPDGSGLIYSTYLGGSSDDQGNAIAVDANGNAYVTGITDSVDFPTVSPLPGQGSYRGGASDAFVSKLSFDPVGLTLSLAYSTYLGGNGLDSGNGIALFTDPGTGITSAFVAGETRSNVFFPITGGSFQTSIHGGQDGFVIRISDS